MVFAVHTMKQHDNDDEKLSFVTLATATRNVTRYLGLDAKDDERAHQNRKDTAEADKKALEQSEFVDRRLKELAAFERRYGLRKN